MKHSILLFFLFTLSFFNTGISQTDFDNYTTLLSKGEMPDDFSSFTYKKVEDNISQNEHNIDLINKKEFYISIHYSVDDILHSGKVVYGDEISLYVKEIVKKLLVDEPKLYETLRFYVIKSNECNAFSTDQGIIFVTTGLIAQLENEAQLAFVLSHEISHYVKKHVVNTFIYKSKTRLNIQELSIYSKEKEFEADTYGIKWYNRAGYSQEQLYSAFDILMYSYLPFDEVKFPTNYFNTSEMHVPESMFSTQEFTITAKEDYDDSRSSHPNIKKRKEAVLSTVNALPNWENNSFLLDENTFFNIRNICRFEWVRDEIIDRNHVNALYAIFLLEQDFPNSIFLKRMKAQAWFGLSVKAIYKTTNEVKPRYEGEIASLNFFIEHLTPDAINTMALRQVYDLRKQTGNDPQIIQIYNYLIRNLSTTTYFKIDQHKRVNYLHHLQEVKNAQDAQKVEISDSTTTQNQNSKYAKINSKKENKIEEKETDFYLYGISDLVTDTVFTSFFKKNQEENKVKKQNKSEVVDLLDMSISSRNSYLKALHKQPKTLPSIDSLIVVEPVLYSRSMGKNKPIRTEKLQYEFSNAIAESAKEVDMTVFFIDRNHMDSSSTKEFNVRSTMYASLYQIYNGSHPEVVPVDFELLKQIKEEYNSSRVSFLWVNHLYMTKDETTNLMRVWAAICYPFVAPYIFLSAHKMQINTILFNLDKCEIELTRPYFVKDVPTQRQLSVVVYDILSMMKQKTY